MRFNPDEYITVAERIEKFYARHPEGKINTTIVEHDREAGFVLMRAEVYRKADDELPAATGHAYEMKGGSGANVTSHIENAETSAVGRAIANLGFEIKRGVASRDEMQKAERQQPQAGDVTREEMAALDGEIMALQKQLGKTDASLAGSVRAKFNLGQLGNWDEASYEQKTWLRGFLQKKAAA